MFPVWCHAKGKQKNRFFLTDFSIGELYFDVYKVTQCWKSVKLCEEKGRKREKQLKLMDVVGCNNYTHTNRET